MFIPYVNRATIRIAHWIDSMVSIDRLICVAFPHKFKIFSNRKFALRIVLGLILLQLTLNSPNLFFRLRDDNVWNPLLNQTQTIRLCTASKDLVMVRDFLDQLVRSVIPLIIQISSSAIIIFKLIKSRRNVIRFKLNERDRRFNFTIILLNLFFFLTQTP